MNQKPPVPRLDLAPKLKRPLSLWNPLDYLRLLYWVFYFPQALRWYVDEFGGGYIPGKGMNWSNRIQRNLLLQGLVLTVATPLILSILLQKVGVAINDQSMNFGVVFGLVGAMVFGVARGVTEGVGFGVAFGVAVGMAEGVASELVGVVAFGVVFGLVGAVAFGVARAVAFFGVVSVAGGMTFGFVVAAGIGCGIVTVRGIVVGVVLGLASGLVGTVAGGLAVLRLENWLISLNFSLRNPHKDSLQIPRITPLPLPSLSVRLYNWLQQDWEAGLHNINQLLTYTLQFVPVVQAVNRVLAKTPPEQIIWRVSRLAEAPLDWHLVHFISASLEEGISNLDVQKADTQLDTPAQAAAAGFWYLHEKNPAKAEEAFAVVRSLLYGEEMFTLAQTLTIFHQAEKITTIAAINPPSPPYQGNNRQDLLRSNTWQAIASLHRVIEDTQLVQRSVSRATRAFALNHAQGELTNILNHPQILPEAERGLIIEIAQNWQQALLQVAGEVGEISITKPVRNPYIIGDPVLGQRFVGREDVIRELEELWLTSESLQSVVLYGHRRMGKTSILRNAANSVGSGVKVAYVNMLNAGNISQGVGEVLMAICDVISETANLPPPSDADLLNLPYRTFERYLKRIVEIQLTPSQQGLIIALDEFEKIEELIAAEKIPSDFMGYLRGLVQMYPQVAFAFAGLHTLEEMTADYFEPFFASVIPIHVGFMERGATRQILANPVEIENTTSEDFPLDCTPGALDHIYHLTHGQPYLVQLVGFQLVRRYNDLVFEMGHSRDPVFTVNDVEAVVNPEFFKRGRYYFDGVWSQAAQGAANQQTILQALAPHIQGLTLQELVETTGINYQDIQDSLCTLERHDVVEEHEGHWRIVVELFRRWVVQNR